MEWIDVKDRMPEKECKILILIGESIFCINVRISEPGSCYLNLEKIYCEIVKTYEFESDIPLSIGIGKSLQMNMKYKATFFKPSYYKDVTHWCEVPQLPKKNEETGWVRKGNEDEEFYQRFGGSGKIHIKENKDG